MATAAPARQKIGSYLIGPTLGEGGFSTVKLGMHESTGEKVALKILKNKHKMTESVRKQVEREITAMSKIDHVNVLKMKECLWDCTYTKRNGKKLNVILIVLELATGGELFEFLSYTGLFEERLARTYLIQLLAGLEHCHAKGIAHRDLKPENLLMDANYRLKIADFGFSNVVTATQKVMYTECGTPGYMAPEMFARKGYEGRVADMWSVGVILFIMLAGFPPFQRPSNSDWWFNKLANGKQHLFWQAHERSASFSDSTKDLINRLLATDPAKRITMAQLKQHPWLRGDTIEKEAFQQQLARRKAQVDAVKKREKERKRGEAMDLSDDSVMRGDGKEVVRSDSDELPAAPPSMAMGAYVFSKPTLYAGDDDDDELDFGEREEKRVVTELDTTVHRYTRFVSDKDPLTIIQRLADVARANGGKIAESRTEFRTDVELRGVNLAAQVFKGPKAGQYYVDFRRRQGPSHKFRQLYTEMRAQTPDLLVSSV